MNQTDGSSSFRASLQRGVLLRQNNRYADAEKYLQLAIGEQPENADGYYELAFCYCDWPGHEKKALATIDRALSLDPGRPGSYALRGWILGNLNRPKEAIQSADEALALNPEHILALNAQVRAYVNLHEWKKAEAQARRVLELHAQNELALNLLAVSLRQQGRREESDAVTASLLALVPDNAMAQGNAGWSALQVGDYRRANRHFLEALRLQPDYDYARRGLLHAFNSRVWIYRVYFQFVAWLSRHRRGTRIFLLLVIYAVYRTVVITVQREYGEASIHWVTVLVALYLVVFGFGRSFGNFFLLFDRFARHALTGKETNWALFAAGFYGLLLASEVIAQAWAPAAILASIPLCFLWAALSPRVADAFASLRRGSSA